VDPAGRVHLAWSERRDRRWSSYEAMRRPGGSWSPPTTVVRDRPFAIGVMGIAANAAGRTALVWAYAGDRQGVVVAATRAGGGPWGAEQALSRPVWNAISGVHVGIDAAGTATVIGRGLDGPGLWATQQTAGGTWQPLRRISPAGLGIDAPTLRVSAGGRVCVLALLKRHGRPPVLWFREANAAGCWGGESLIPRSDHARLPDLAATDDGTVVAAWLRETPSSARLLIAARGAAGAWSTPATLERGPSGFVELASLMPEAKGATAVWSDWIRRPQDREVAIRARAISSAGRLLRPATVALLRLAPVAAPPGTRVIYGPAPVPLVVAAGPSPTVAWIATSELSPTTPAAVQAATRDADGSWGRPESLSTPGRFAYPLAAGTAPGRTVVVWTEGPPASAAAALMVSERPEGP
jgi:hypothetical protein